MPTPTKQDLNRFGAELLHLLAGEHYFTFDNPEPFELYAEELIQYSKQQLGNTQVRGGLRVSQLGKPAVVQACSLPHVAEELRSLGLEVEEKRNLRMLELLHRGDQWEAWVKMLLRHWRWCISDTARLVREQEEVEYMGVKGHIDFVLDLYTDAGPVLVEVKTMSGRYFDQFTRQPNDDRGYITQLTCYKEALGLPAVWLCLDKSTHNVAVVQHPGDEATEAVKSRLSNLVPKMKLVCCLEDVFKLFNLPPGIPEVFKRNETGRLLVHPAMRYSPLRFLFYKISTEPNGYNKSTEYIVGVNTYSEAVEYLSACNELCVPGPIAPTTA
jgi:hypothetical protein